MVNFMIFYEVNNIQVFKASFIGSSKKISELNLLKLFVGNMFQNIKVTFGILQSSLETLVKRCKIY